MRDVISGNHLERVLSRDFYARNAAQGSMDGKHIRKRAPDHQFTAGDRELFSLRRLSAYFFFTG